jgi:hypothetical protein
LRLPSACCAGIAALGISHSCLWGMPPHCLLPCLPWRALQAYGMSMGTMMCQRLIAGGVPGLHMYTLNLERSAVAILENVGEFKDCWAQLGGRPFFMQ